MEIINKKSEAEQKLFSVFESVKNRLPLTPKFALVLGSGLGGFAEGGGMEVAAVIPYGDIENFPVATAPGHAGRFVFGHIAGVPSVVMQGRIHWYEGYHVTDTVLPVRLMRLMGADTLLLTNAVGSINTSYRPGDFMLISDHISSFAPNPLVGANFEITNGLSNVTAGDIDGACARFPDMSEVYSERLRSKIRKAKPSDAVLHEGVYVQTTGPSYESPAEIRMLRSLGADVVGMSTVTEAIAARHCGFEVAGISAVSNFGCGVTNEKLSHQDVLDMAEKIGPRFQNFVRQSVDCIFNQG